VPPRRSPRTSSLQAFDSVAFDSLLLILELQASIPQPQPRPPYAHNRQRQRHRHGPVDPKPSRDLHRLGLEIEHGGAEEGGDEGAGEEDGC